MKTLSKLSLMILGVLSLALAVGCGSTTPTGGGGGGPIDKENMKKSDLKPPPPPALPGAPKQ